MSKRRILIAVLIAVVAVTAFIGGNWYQKLNKDW